VLFVDNSLTANKDFFTLSDIEALSRGTTLPPVLKRKTVFNTVPVLKKQYGQSNKRVQTSNAKVLSSAILAAAGNMTPLSSDDDRMALVKDT
jgi:hypothetical protein